MSLSLAPVSAAVYSALHVAALTTLAPGGVHDDVPQSASFPWVLYEVQERDVRGFGGGALPEVDLRVRVFSTYPGKNEAQRIIAKAIELLKDQTLTVTGFDHCGRVIYDSTVLVGDEEINGVVCHELAANFRIYVEAQ